VDGDVAERVLSRPHAQELRGLGPVGLEGARARFGRGISDEELLLRLTVPGEQVDAIGTAATERVAIRPVPQSARAMRAPVGTLLDEVASRPSIVHLRVETDDEVVEWRRQA
jgi:oxaloacetate decarboxylase alpha subunit